MTKWQLIRLNFRWMAFAIIVFLAAHLVRKHMTLRMALLLQMVADELNVIADEAEAKGRNFHG